MKKIHIALVCAAGLNVGCATVLNDDQATITVTSSSNERIQASVAGREFTVPGMVRVPRDGSDYVITTRSEGCAPTTPVSRKMDTAFVGNLVVGGSFGSSTDYSTGKMWEYQENVVITCAD